MAESVIKRKTVTVSGVRLFCLDTESERPPVLCLHGMWGRAQTWSDLIYRYQDRFRVIAPDQRGHGLSDRPKEGYKAGDFAGDMHELLNKLGCESVIAVGHSMGARIAAYFAALYPGQVKALAILDGSADGPEEPSVMPVDESSADDGLTADWPVPFATYSDAIGFLASQFEPESNVRYFAESLIETETGYDFLFSRYALAAIAVESKSWYDLLPQISCPVLLVRATESWCLSAKSAEKMRGMIKDCTYFEVSNSDHMVYADNPDEFYPQFEDWLASVGA